MTISIRAIANADDCLVVWRAPTVPGCLGYQLERESTHKGVTTIAVLDNRLGWAGDPSQPFEHQPSSRWPFRRYAWTDFQAPLDSSLRYRVTPVFDRAGSNFVDNGRQSSWSNAVTQSGEAGDCAVYFNRGIALSQFMARELKGDYSPTALRGFKDNLAHTENRLRKFLGGDILRELIRLLDTAINDETIELYAALYELTDEQLIGKLETLGARAHVVLSNGSSKSAPDDENESARERLKAADVSAGTCGPRRLGEAHAAQRRVRGALQVQHERGGHAREHGHLKEKEQNRPPRAFRELFRVLRELEEGGVDDEADNIESGDEE